MVWNLEVTARCSPTKLELGVFIVIYVSALLVTVCYTAHYLNNAESS